MPTRPPRAKSSRAEYSPETRAAAVAALLAGQSVSSVAEQYNIPKGTVSNWKNRGVGVPNGETQKVADRKEGIGDLLVELLESNLKGLIAATRVLHDDAWLSAQSAAELGTFIGITHDKVIRMLEAMDRSAAPAPASE